LELGCGKGTLTQFFKKKNNRIKGIDISQTAIERAKASFPDIEFICAPIDEYVSCVKEKFDLSVIMGTLAYLEHWPSLISKLAEHSEYLCVGEFVPKNPIGYVKNIPDLIQAYEKDFDIETKVILDDEHILLMENQKNDNILF
jgi:SAM-dependent methyltransferase